MALADYLAVDESSPTGLRWIQQPRKGRVRVGDPAMTANHGGGYFCGKFQQVQYLAHQVVYYLHHGEWADEIDHHDGNKRNNSPGNLRKTDHASNQQNIPARGAVWLKREQKWRARITTKGKTTYLGLYDTEEEARAVYLQAKRGQHTQAGQHCFQ